MDSMILFVLTVIGITIVAIVYLIGSRNLFKKTKYRVVDLDTIHGEEDVAEHIKSLLEQYIPLTVKFDERSMDYHSYIKAVNTYASPCTFSLESLEPKEGNALALDSNYISITYHYPTKKKYAWSVGQKTLYGFTTVCIPPDSNEETDVKLLLPETIDKVQKRDFLRIEPPYDRPIFAKFVDDDGDDVQEQLVNISGGGFGFFTTRGVKTFAKGTLHNNVILNIQDTFLPIEQAVVANIIDRTKIVGRGGKSRFFCGIQFVKIDERVRTKIIQYVIQIEREDLRRLSRMFD